MDRIPMPMREWIECLRCAGVAYFLGRLGRIEWYKCRDCGAEIQS